MNNNKLEQAIREMVEENLVWLNPYLLIEKQNGISGNIYSGVNKFLLVNSTDEFFFTFNQVKKLGGHVKKGEHGYIICFYQPAKSVMRKVVDEDGNEIEQEIRLKPVLTTHYVFGLSQIELPEKIVGELKKKNINKEIDKKKINEIIDAISNKIKQNLIPNFALQYDNTTNAYYVLGASIIRMPEPDHYISEQEAITTLAHEIGHLLLHELLDAKIDVIEEEIVVETSSIMVAEKLGYSIQEHLRNNIAYIKVWRNKIQNNKDINWVKIFNYADKIYSLITM